jgi:hypothetical protein
MMGNIATSLVRLKQSVVTSGCWACQLARGNIKQHKTQWLYVGHEGAVVLDNNPAGYTYRLLFVPREHVAEGQETVGMKHIAERL